MKIPEKFTSRKFLMALGAILTALGGGFTGAIEWSQAVNVIIGAVVAYIAAEGTNDVVKTMNE